jgi:RNA polymerase sigma factor (sigma-70 family)
MIQHVHVLGLDRGLDAQARVERLVLEHQTKLARYVRRFVGDPDIALDLVQDVFLAAYRVLHADPARPLTAGWLYKAATNRSISYLRRHKRTGEVPTPADVAESFRLDERSAVSLDLQAALARLAPEQLTCIMLTAYAGYSSQEVSAILGISPEAVRQRVCRAMRAMRRSLEGPPA